MTLLMTKMTIDLIILETKSANIGSKFNNKNFFSSPDLDGEYL